MSSRGPDGSRLAEVDLEDVELAEDELAEGEFGAGFRWGL